MIFVAACEQTPIDPFDNDERYYTIYGYIDQLELNHTVRVIPVTRFPERIASPSDAQAFLDATVTSTNLNTGQTIIWNHSLEQLDDGMYGHIFRTSFLPQAGHTYRLTVRRSDDKITTAETRIPFLSETRPTPDTLFFPYEISPDSGLRQEIYLPDIPSPWDMKVTYDLQGLHIRLPYGRVGERTESAGWQFTIDMGADAPRLRTALNLSETAALPLLHAIELQVRVLDTNWDPADGIFDPERLAQPGTLSNVVNGYGFWGSIGLYQYTWVAPPQ